MGGGHSGLRSEDIEQLESTTGFSKKQLNRLYNRFCNLDRNGGGYLTRDDFMQVEELVKNPLHSRIINLFFTVGRVDPDTPCNGKISFRDFVYCLSRFRPTKVNSPSHHFNNRRDKLRFAFNMYDLDEDDRITRNELLKVVRMMVGKNISEEQLGSIADRTVMEADESGDGSITFDEFEKAMVKVDIEQKLSIRFKGGFLF